MRVLTFIMIVVSFVFTSGIAYGGELALAASFCNKLEGEVEVRLKDATRVDCLTEEYAFEVDYAPKWAESVAQTLHYANMTGKKPAIAIIVKSEKDIKYMVRLANVLIKLRPVIHIAIITDNQK